jgi:aminoglycoside 3-N-acetyltransferase I
MEIRIQKLGENDIREFTGLIRLFERVFEMKDFVIPEDRYLKHLLGQSTFLAFTANLEGEVIGGITAYILPQYYSEKPLVYIYDLAVKVDMQRKGIGKALISSIINYCKEMGMEEVFVQADEVDDYALDFYRSTGAIEEKVRHYYYPLTQ